MEVFLSLNDAERYAKENHMSSGELSYIYNEFYLLITKDILKSKINYFVYTLIEEVL